MINFDAIKAEATGQWSGIFAQVGIEVGNGKHLPCPLCGGKDRFRFDDQGGRGTWICNQCGAGDGLKLLMRAFKDDYKGAMNRLAGVLGHTDYSPSTVKKHRHNNARRLLNEVWRSSNPWPATTWLRSTCAVVGYIWPSMTFGSVPAATNRTAKGRCRRW